MKRNVAILLFFSLLLGAVSLSDYFWFERSKTDRVSAVVRLTGIASPVWRVAWHEPRFRRYRKACYTPYPEFPAADRLGFVYRNHHDP